MGCRIMTGQEAGSLGVYQQEVFFCSTSGWAFGPVMGEGQAEPFMDWLAEEKGIGDPREVRQQGELETLWTEWVKAAWQCDQCETWVTGDKPEEGKLLCEGCAELSLVHP